MIRYRLLLCSCLNVVEYIYDSMMILCKCETHENVCDRRSTGGRTGPVGGAYVEAENRVVHQLVESTDRTYQTRVLVHVEISFFHGISDHRVPYVRVQTQVRIDRL